MPQVNTALKRTFTVFNIIFAIIGAVIISLAIVVQILTKDNAAGIEGRLSSLIILYVVGGATLAIALLGAYGAHKENYAAMVVFLVFMVCGSLAMLRIGIPAAIFRPRLDGVLEDTFHQMTPLDRASQEVQNMVNNVQSMMHCCGLFSADDWNEAIPSSCMCDSEREDDCRVIDYLTLLRPKRSIYRQTCVPLIIPYVVMAVDIMLGVIFSLCVVALLGLVLSSVIVHQMRFSKTPTMRVVVPAIFSHMPPKYQELQNPPSY